MIKVNETFTLYHQNKIKKRLHCNKILKSMLDQKIKSIVRYCKMNVSVIVNLSR